MDNWIQKLKPDINIKLIGMKKDNICFILIPKNAHLSMQYTLENEGFKRIFINNISPGVKYSAIIREPFDKWISGFATYLTNCVNNKVITEEQGYQIFKKQEYIDYVFETIEFDIHTIKQYSILKKVQDQKIDLFLLSNLDPVVKYFNENGVNITGVDTAHQTKNFPPDGFHYKIYHMIHNFMDKNIEYRDSIMKYYEEDYIIYNDLRGKQWMNSQQNVS